MKKIVLFLFGLVLVFGLLGFVSASLCKGSDGYYRDCNSKPKMKTKIFNGPYTDYIVKKTNYANSPKPYYGGYYGRNYGGCYGCNSYGYYRGGYGYSSFNRGYYSPYFSGGYGRYTGYSVRTYSGARVYW